MKHKQTHEKPKNNKPQSHEQKPRPSSGYGGTHSSSFNTTRPFGGTH